MNLTEAMTVLGFAGGLVGVALSLHRKAYGLERDVNHLKNDYKTLSSVLAEMDRNLEQINIALALLKARIEGR